MSGEATVIHLTVGGAEKAMDCYQFIASLVGSLAWPIAAVMIALLFRSQITALLVRVKEFGWGDKKVTFNEEVKKLEEELDAVDAAPERPSVTSGDTGMAFDQMPRSLSDRQQLESARQLLDLMELVAVAPDGAVTESWKLVSNDVERIAKKHGLGETKPYLGRTFDTAKKLKGKGVFTTQMMTILAQLRKVRNAAAHGRAVDAEGALRYIALVQRFLKLIEDI